MSSLLLLFLTLLFFANVDYFLLMSSGTHIAPHMFGKGSLYWQDCDKSLKKNLNGVCAVYKRNALEYMLSPLLNEAGAIILRDGVSILSYYNSPSFPRFVPQAHLILKAEDTGDEEEDLSFLLPPHPPESSHSSQNSANLENIAPKSPHSPSIPYVPNDPSNRNSPHSLNDPNSPHMSNSPHSPNSPRTLNDPNIPNSPHSPNDPNSPHMQNDPNSPHSPNIPNIPISSHSLNDPNSPHMPHSPNDPNIPISEYDQNGPISDSEVESEFIPALIGKMRTNKRLTKSVGVGGERFKRWRRQAEIKALVYKCCSKKGCTNLDFVLVDTIYNVCE